MIDNLGNQIEIGDTVIIAVRSGRTATLEALLKLTIALHDAGELK